MMAGRWIVYLRATILPVCLRVFRCLLGEPVKTEGPGTRRGPLGGRGGQAALVDPLALSDRVYLCLLVRPGLPRTRQTHDAFVFSLPCAVVSRGHVCVCVCVCVCQVGLFLGFHVLGSDFSLHCMF